jgi:hypothetical protein
MRDGGMTTAQSDGGTVEAEPSGETEKACRFSWFDGKNSHLCSKAGPHERHFCSYCAEYHDPTLRLVTGKMGEFIIKHLD